MTLDGIAYDCVFLHLASSNTNVLGMSLSGAKPPTMSP